MTVLLVEDDVLIAELIQSVILSLSPATRVICVNNSREAIDLYFKEKPQLILCDWQLEGLDTSKPLLQQLSQAAEEVQVLIVTAHAQKNLVKQAQKLGVSQILVKPFSPEALAGRLKPFLTASSENNNAEPVSVQDWLTRHSQSVESLPNLAATSDLIGELPGFNELSPNELAAKCHQYVNLTERLIRVANNSQMRRTGKPIDSVSAAIATIGVDMAVAQIIAITLTQASEAITDPCVLKYGETINKRSLELAELSAKLAHAAKIDARLCFTAGLMAFIGELAVLSALDLYSKEKVALTEDAIQAAMQDFAPIYGNYLKQHWRVPMKLRQTIGAAHKLSTLSCDKNQVVIHLANKMTTGCSDTKLLMKLSRLAGLPEQMILEAVEAPDLRNEH